MRQESINVDGLEFKAIASGDGPPVILLHGFPDVNTSFGYHVDHLARRGYRAVAPALRGYPPTNGPGPYTVDQLGKDAVSLAEAIGMSPTSPGYAVGHDWGGIAVCVAASMRPELFAKIVVASVPHPTTFGARIASGDYDQLKRSWYMFFFQLEGIPEAVIRASKMAFLERLMLDWSPSLLRNEGSELVEARMRALGQPGALEAALAYYRSAFGSKGAAPPIVGPVSVPALSVFGSEDACIPASVTEGMEALFPAGLRREVISGAGHFVHTEKPSAFLETVCSFFED